MYFFQNGVCREGANLRGFLDVQNPRMLIGNRSGLTKRSILFQILIFFEKRKKLTPTLLYCASNEQLSNNSTFKIQNPKMSFGNRSGLAKRFCTCPKSQNVVWKPTGLTKRTFLFYGPMAPGAHRAHTLLINVFIYVC